MRRPRYTGEAAVNEAVYRLMNKFEYPDEVGEGAPFVPGGGGGAPTIVVAASDASDISKSKADYVCIGVNDQGTLQAAADQLPAGGGRLLLTEGFYDLSDELNLPDDITFQGMGREATYIFGSVATFVIDMATTSVVRDMSIENSESGGGCIDAVSGRSLISNCYFESWDSSSWSVRKSAGSDLTIMSSTFNGDGDGVITTAGSKLFLINCIFTGGNRGVFVDGGDTILILGCEFNDNLSWGIEFDSVTEAFIIGSFLIQSGTSSNGGIRLLNSSQITVDATLIKDSGEHGIVLDGSSQCVISSVFEGNGQLTANTYDHINITGASTRNKIWSSNFLASAQTRYGVNVGGTGECNIVVGNDLGDPDDYGTDALEDTASNTQLIYPNDMTYGDNFTDCGSGS